LVLAAVVSAILSEGALRLLLGAPVRYRHPQEQYAHDHETGFWLMPRQQAFTHDRRITTNRLGLRDQDHPQAAPPGTRRIIALGDSQTFGNGLSDDETWPGQLEAELRASDATEWEVINAGIPATDTWQHEIVLRRLQQVYGFDGVVLAVYVNDIATPYRIGPEDVSPHQATRRLLYLLRRSALFSLVWRIYREREPGNDAGARELHILTGARDAEVDAGWEQFEKSIHHMLDDCRSRGQRLWIVVLPRRDQVSGVLTASTFNARVVDLARRLGIPTIDMLPVLRAAWPVHGNSLFIAWDGHNSAIANRLIAEQLAALIHAEAPIRP
jgi:lysophospholipase L1-like esterase